MPTQGVWLECNGQSTASYPSLAAVVGANVPNYQGIFLRGYGSQTSTHYNTVTHSSAAFGTLQGDAIRNITAAWYSSMWVYPDANAWVNFAQGAVTLTKHSAYNNDVPGGNRFGNGTINFNASRVIPTATENRPVNKAVRYLIKAA